MPDDCGIFDRIYINSTLPVGQNISWKMAKNFQGVFPLHFYVDVAPIGSEDWTTLNKVPVIDDCSYFDPNKYNYSVSVDQTYRIRVVDGDDNVFYSNPQHPLGNWSKRDYLLAKEMMRKEYLELTKFTGVKGTLLKRRQWGPRCPRCLDPDTDAVTDNKCFICYGTAFIGGYFMGIEYWVKLSNLKRNKDVTDVAITDPFNRLGRSVAYPYLDTKDVWVSEDTNERWFISNIANEAEIRSIPIVYSSEYKKAPTSSVIYDVPLDSTADLTIYLDDTAMNSPVKLDNNDPVNPSNAPVAPPDEQWDAGVTADPFSW